MWTVASKHFSKPASNRVSKLRRRQKVIYASKPLVVRDWGTLPSRKAIRLTQGFRSQDRILSVWQTSVILSPILLLCFGCGTAIGLAVVDRALLCGFVWCSVVVLIELLAAWFPNVTARFPGKVLAVVLLTFVACCSFIMSGFGFRGMYDSFGEEDHSESIFQDGERWYRHGAETSDSWSSPYWRPSLSSK
jgi:hypothetical protein